MPSAISVNMLRLRVTSDAQPRTKNGQPAHSTTGVARPVAIQFETAGREQHMQTGQMPAHLQRDHRHGERERDPEAPRHVDEFGVRAFGRRRDLRLQRHAADRAAARADLADLRMHRAGVDRARGGDFCGGASAVLVRYRAGSAANLSWQPPQQK